MPAQLIRKVRDRRPSYQVGIDWGNPITAGLAFAFDAAYGKRDLVTGVTGGAAGAGIVPGIGRFGPQTTFSGTQADNSYEFGVHKGLFGATGTTFDILVYFSTGNQTSHFFGQWDGNDQEWLLQNSGGTLVWVAADDTMSGTNRTRFDLSFAFTNAGWYRIIAAWRGGTDRTLIINGVEKVPSVNQSNATAVSTTSLDKITIGKTVGGSALNGTIVFARAWRRGLTNGECRALSSAPWIIFPDETIPLFWTGVTAQSATASIAAAIRSDRTASASLSAAIQSAATASATLSGAIQTAQSATSGLTAYIVASSARSSSASLSAAISDARTATSSLSAAVAAARIATAALDSAVQIEVTASTGVSAAIREAFSISANLSGAVQASATASASLAAVVAKTNAISSDLSAAVRAERTASAGLSTVIAASVWPNAEDVKQGVVYGPQGFDYTGEFAGGGGPITRVMQGAEPETIIKTVVRTVYVDRPAASQIHDKRLLNTQEDEELADTRARLIRRKLLTEAFSEHQTTIKAQEVEIASLRSENEALAALLMATMQ